MPEAKSGSTTTGASESRFGSEETRRERGRDGVVCRWEGCHRNASALAVRRETQREFGSLRILRRTDRPGDGWENSFPSTVNISLPVFYLVVELSPTHHQDSGLFRESSDQSEVRSERNQTRSARARLVPLVSA